MESRVPTRSIFRGDPGVVGCHDLRPATAFLHCVPAEVDLVAVVLRRVVAGSHHHTAVAIEGTDGVGKQRRRERLRHQERLDSRGGEDRGGLLREDVGVVAGVVADDGAGPGARRGFRHRGGQERSEAGGRAPHNDAIHAVGTGAQLSAKACRAELQRSAEAVLKLLAGCGHPVRGKLDEFCRSGGSCGIRVLGGPVTGGAQKLRKFGIGRRHRTKLSPNGPDAMPRHAQPGTLTVNFPDT